jgi:hypothetical protein
MDMKGKLHITWKDGDGDVVTISTDRALQDAKEDSIRRRTPLSLYFEEKKNPQRSFAIPLKEKGAFSHSHLYNAFPCGPGKSAMPEAETSDVASATLCFGVAKKVRRSTAHFPPKTRDKAQRKRSHCATDVCEQQRMSKKLRCEALDELTCGVEAFLKANDLLVSEMQDELTFAKKTLVGEATASTNATTAAGPARIESALERQNAHLKSLDELTLTIDSFLANVPEVQELFTPRRSGSRSLVNK